MHAAVRLIGDREMIDKVKEILSENGVTVEPVSVAKVTGPMANVLPGDHDALIEVMA